MWPARAGLVLLLVPVVAMQALVVHRAAPRARLMLWSGRALETPRADRLLAILPKAAERFGGLAFTAERAD